MVFTLIPLGVVFGVMSIGGILTYEIIQQRQRAYDMGMSYDPNIYYPPQEVDDFGGDHHVPPPPQTRTYLTR